MCELAKNLKTRTVYPRDNNAVPFSLFFSLSFSLSLIAYFGRKQFNHLTIKQFLHKSKSELLHRDDVKNLDERDAFWSRVKEAKRGWKSVPRTTYIFNHCIEIICDIYALVSTLGTSAEKARTRVTEGKKVTGIERKREREIADKDF